MRRPRLTWIEVLVLGGIVALVISILLPSLNRLRETSHRPRCPSNLKQIGQAILLYENDHGGPSPDSFATILTSEDLVPEVFVCDSDDGATPAKDNAAFVADPGPAHCSYVYVGDRLSVNAPADALVAFDRPANHDGDGVNALFGDGHVEFLPFTGRQRPPAWWLDVESQIARGVRPVMMPPAATQPTR